MMKCFSDDGVMLHAGMLLGANDFHCIPNARVLVTVLFGALGSVCVCVLHLIYSVNGISKRRQSVGL